MDDAYVPYYTSYLQCAESIKDRLVHCQKDLQDAGKDLVIAHQYSYNYLIFLIKCITKCQNVGL